MSRRAALRPYPPPFQSTGPLSTGSTKKDALRRCSTSKADGTCDLRLSAHIRFFASGASDFRTEHRLAAVTVPCLNHSGPLLVWIPPAPRP
jgi:hypothetical protein